MRTFDFIGQTFLFVLTLLCLAWGREGFIFVAIVQFFMGIWQLVSAIVTSFQRNHGSEQRTLMIRIYWGLVAFYFFGLIAMMFLMKENELVYTWFFSAWLIAIYYYVFTIKLTFGDNGKKTFLDVAN